MITGPFCPLLACGLCAAGPWIPFVVTLPLPSPSASTRMVPEPEAEVDTGGTAWPPVRLSFMASPPEPDWNMEQAARLSAASAEAARRRPVWTSVMRVLLGMDDVVPTAPRLEYSDAANRRLGRPGEVPRARSLARARRADVRAPARRLRRRRHPRRDAAGRGSQREHGRAARRARHAEPASKQARDDAQSQAAGGARGLRPPRADGRRGGGKLPARRQAPPRHRLRDAARAERAHHPRA